MEKTLDTDAAFSHRVDGQYEHDNDNGCTFAMSAHTPLGKENSSFCLPMEPAAMSKCSVVCEMGLVSP